MGSRWHGATGNTRGSAVGSSSASANRRTVTQTQNVALSDIEGVAVGGLSDSYLSIGLSDYGAIDAALDVARNALDAQGGTASDALFNMQLTAAGAVDATRGIASDALFQQQITADRAISANAEVSGDAIQAQLQAQQAALYSVDNAVSDIADVSMRAIASNQNVAANAFSRALNFAASAGDAALDFASEATAPDGGQGARYATLGAIVAGVLALAAVLR